MTIVAVDGYNMLHRARSGFNKGDYPICYNFFRGFRSLVEQFNPNRVYFVLEGCPVRRLETFPEYKANRTQDPALISSQKLTEIDNFLRQKTLIIDLLKTCFPISVMRHPKHEGDDVIYNLIKRSSTAVDWIVVSNDSDFTQLLNQFDHVKIYNPMMKSFVEKPTFDYVSWKALRGDPSDNIPKVPGFSDAKAEALVLNQEKFKEFCKSDSQEAKQWADNFDLIHFFEFSDFELSQIESSSPIYDWTPLKKSFEDWRFQSMLKDGSWEKFISTFDKLWGTLTLVGCV